MSKSRFNLPIPFGWYAIAQSSELQSSEVKPLSYFDRALTLFRTSTGQARVIDAMCPHLGANLSYGTVVENSVMCPFHGWKFDGDGFCTDVPYAKRMPPKVDGKKCMTSYHTREINSMIWAWYHPDDIDPLYELDPVAELNGGNWAEPTVYEWEVAAPIQETGENAVGLC